MPKNTLLAEVERVIIGLLDHEQVKVYRDPLSIPTSEFAEKAIKLLETQFHFVIAVAGDNSALWVVTHRDYAKSIDLQSLLAEKLYPISIAENNVIANQSDTIFLYATKTKQF